MQKSPILSAKLSLDSNIPLYSQLVSLVSRNISGGVLQPGDLLPSETELCKTFGISRSTVRQAIGALEADGLVVRKQGRGTFVAEPTARRKTETVYSFTSEISSLGKTPSSTLLSFEIVPATPALAELLELDNLNTNIYQFTRVRNVDGEPLIVETSYYPQFIYPTLTAELLKTHSFYSLLYEVDILPYSAKDTYRATVLGEREANLLGRQVGEGAFLSERHTRTESGMLYEVTISVIRGDRVQLDVFLHREGVAFARKIDS